VTYISRAQNFEDYRVYRALKHVEVGKYIDVGAWDPEYHSVSHNFYENGWRGVNIDADEVSFLKLSTKRPLDLNLNNFVTSKSGVIDFLSVSKSGLSTGNKLIAEKLKDDSTLKTSTHKIKCITLDSIFSQLESEEVHWLKIDVEGSELEVLESWGTNLSRPWIVIVEATTPGTAELDDNAWEKYLLERDYIFAYFDGLNKFYVNQNQKHLIRSIQSPISIFDDVITFENQLRYDALQQINASLSTGTLNLIENFVGQPKVDLLAAEIQQLVETRKNQNVTIANYKKLIDHFENLLQSSKNSLCEAQSELARIKKSKAYRVIRPLLSLYFKLLNFNMKVLLKKISLKIVAQIIRNKRCKMLIIKYVSPKFVLKIRNKLYFNDTSLKLPEDTSVSDLPMLELEQLLQDFRN
jgi:FkbM family methyltransferase